MNNVFNNKKSNMNNNSNAVKDMSNTCTNAALQETEPLYSSFKYERQNNDIHYNVKQESKPFKSTKEILSDSNDQRFKVSRKMIVAAVANASASYNLTIIGYVILLMSVDYPFLDPGIKSVIASCSLFGAISGQLFLGFIGDCYGRRTGMIVTLLLIICGALASAILPPYDEKPAYILVGACRFILGIGVGGVYPLSATSAIESGNDSFQNNRRVILAFAFQGWGQLLAPVMTVAIIRMSSNYAADWRVLLGIGAIPGILVLREAILAKESEVFLRSYSDCSLTFSQVLHNSDYRNKLIGTTVSWFLFDITFYGNVIFTPIVLRTVFEINQTDLTSVAIYSALVALFALPGYYVSAWLIPILGHRTIQMQGFLIMAALFILLGVAYDFFFFYKPLLFVVYSLTFFFSNFGPNSTTFSLPSYIFPPKMRSKMNGLSAAFGKLGATFGSGIFAIIQTYYGLPTVLICCGGVSALGAVVTYFYVHPPVSQ